MIHFMTKPANQREISMKKIKSAEVCNFFGCS